jgi:DNA invertase Pin-like site-specific DNA recombinase
MKAFGYSRESTWDQELGLEVQLQQILAYRQTKLPELAWGDFFSDRAVSGGKPFRKRESGAKLDALLQKGDHVVVAKLDRGFRDTLDFLSTEREWNARGIKLHVLDLPFVASDVPEYIADMVRTVLALFAQFERGRIRQRTRDVMRYLKARGLRHNQHAGMGFHWVATGRKDGKKVYERKPHEREQQIMRWIWEQRQAGKTWRDLYFELLLKRERTKEGREWSMTRIKRANQEWESLASSQQTPNGA